MARPAVIDLNLFDLNYYPFMISLEKCKVSCNVVDVLSTKICVPNKTKEVRIKLFSMVTRIYEGKTLVKHISCDCKYKLNSATCNSNQK